MLNMSEASNMGRRPSPGLYYRCIKRGSFMEHPILIFFVLGALYPEDHTESGKDGSEDTVVVSERLSDVT